jgi:cell division septal protein FtsQ
LRLLLAFAFLAGALAVWLTLDARFYVYGAEITGARRVAHEEIFDASELMGLHILWARPAAIEARILGKLPSLESIEVTCGLPSNCTVTVVERRPRVVWNEPGGLWWIDEEGAVFPIQDGAAGLEAVSDAAGLWLVKGPLPRNDTGDLEEQVHVALNELLASEQELPTEFDYSAERGLSFVDEHGWRVIIGRGAGMGERLWILAQMTQHLESQGVTPGLVDLRFPKAPYYSLTGGS